MHNNKKTSLRNWIWKALASSALVPLIMVELVLIAVYMLTNQSIRTSQIEYLHEAAITDLVESVQQNTNIVNMKLTGLGNDVNLFAGLTEHALNDSAASLVPLHTSPDGVRYDNGESDQVASFYSSTTPLAQQDLQKVARLAHLDPLMKQLKATSPLIASVYFNSWDSYNRIYPGFDILQQYPHDMVIPDYNFYYLADPSHNPQRRNRWTEVYLDPAGNGWMMSAIAPVYRDDFLEGVVGLDITVSDLLKQINELKVPWNGYLMLVAPDLTIMAIPQEGERDFHLTELTDHTYRQAVSSETLKPKNFNLRFGGRYDSLAAAVDSKPSGITSVRLDGRSHLVAWDTVADTGWHLLAVVDEADLTAKTNALAAHYRNIGYLLIGGLVVFYLGFFLFMWLRVKKLSQLLLRPLAGVSRMLDEIGEGNWQPEKPETRIDEIATMADRTGAMGEHLAHNEQLRNAAQQRLELVLDSATEGLWEYDVVAGRLHLRGALCRRFGMPEVADGKTLLAARLSPGDIEALTQFVHDLRDERVTDGCEFRLEDLHGRQIWLQCRGRVLERSSHDGSPLLLAGTCLDINTLKHVEMDLRNKTVEAETASQAKSRFISSMTHELKTPLNAIHGFAQLMQLGEPQQETAAEIMAASYHLCQLVNDLLDWSSIQAEKPQLHFAPIDIGKLLNECRDMVRAQVVEAGLTLDIIPVPSGKSIIADARRVRQIVLNLLSNAIKYNRPGGSITLGCLDEGPHTHIFVEDTGTGIDSEAQARLFEPFQRLGKEKTAIPGTGIGLALCKELAQLMNGSLQVRSTAQVGSRFWIELPCAAARASDKRQPPDNHQAGVLCLQRDDPESLLIKEALKDLTTVTLLDDERAFLNETMLQVPQLLIIDLDCMGARIQGLLESIQELHPGIRLPVIVMSSGNMPAYLLNFNCQGMLSKPIDVQELRELAAVFLCEDSPHVQ